MNVFMLRSMRKIWFSLLLSCSVFTAAAQSMADVLASLPQVTEVKILESSTFPEKYELKFIQPIDHHNPQSGTFTQRVVIGNIHPDSASVVVCQGYGAGFAYRKAYRDEISALFNTNDIVVEHRYFLESTPYPGVPYSKVNWEYMTGEQEAEDLHSIVTALKNVYHGKWISTGISKGGQNTMIYRAYFPDDVDFSVPYVGPVCSAVEDGRHEPFISGYCGSAEDREKILEFQKEILKDREVFEPMLDSLARADSLEFNIPIDEVLDYCVLEFPFAFWQWGTAIASIPDKGVPAGKKFEYLMKVAGADYFVNECDTSPFYVQAAKELGYYGYDTRPLEKWLHVKSTKGYLKRLFLPEGCDFEFDSYLYDKVSDFIKTTDARMLFIYGQYDPWSSVMPADPHHENIRFFIHPGGSHRARINTFDDAVKEEIIGILSEWLFE